MIIGLSIFGCFCCVGFTCFCTAACCASAANSGSEDLSTPLLDEKTADVEMNQFNATPGAQTPMDNQYPQYANQINPPNNQYAYNYHPNNQMA